MPQYYDENGKPVEGLLTEEEANQKAEEAANAAVEETNKNIEEEKTNLQEQLDILEQEKAELQEKVEKIDDKDQNFANLRGKVGEKDKKIEELTKKIEELGEKTTTQITELKQSQINEIKEEVIENLAGNDKELKEKIEYFYGTFSGEVNTAKEVKERINNAYTLATGGQKANKLKSSAISSSGGSGLQPQQDYTGKKFNNPDATDVGNKLGLSDKDMEDAGLI